MGVHTGGVSGSKWQRRPWDTRALLGLLPAPSIPRHSGRTCTRSEGLPASLLLQAGQHGRGEAGAPARGGSGVRSCRGTLARGSGLVCCCEDNFDLLPSSVRSKVVGRMEREEEITEHVSTQRYCPPPGNPPHMGEGFLCQKLSQLFSQRALWGYKYLCITRSIF